MAKYNNLYGNCKTVVKNDNNETHSEWAISEACYNYFRYNVFRFERANFTKAALKKAGLGEVETVLENAYWALVDFKAVEVVGGSERGELCKLAYNKVMALMRMLGVAGANREMLWADEWSTVYGAIALVATSKAVVSKTGKRVSCTSYASFRNAFWNSFYNHAVGEEILSLSESQERAREKFVARILAGKKNEKKAH